MVLFPILNGMMAGGARIAPRHHTMTSSNNPAAAAPSAEPSPAEALLNSLPAPDNLAIWNQYRTPDPKACKGFNRSGGFKGTATNAVYLIRCATELWGPMGGNWGIRIAEEKIIEGAIQIWKDHPMPDKIYVIRAELFYPGGTVPAYGQTTLCSINKYGPFTDEEAPKKSLTDALTKALSWLGFASDIHMGLWDDNKHIKRPGGYGSDDEDQPPARREPQQAQPRARQAATAAPPAQPTPEQQALSAARKRCLDLGLTAAGAAAAATELTQGQSQAFSSIPIHILQRMANEGVPADVIARWNAAGAPAAAGAAA